MIRSKADYSECRNRDMRFYYGSCLKDRFMYRITSDPIYYIAKYVRYLRKEEYYSNAKKGKSATLLYLYYLRKKNRLGNKLGIKIPRNCFGPGLQIAHHGEIIVNEAARIGENCLLHGGNCIGNKGTVDDNPVIGDNFDLGIGAKIVGGVKLGNNVTVGANAVVTKSFEDDGITLVGVPAHNLFTNDVEVR